MRRSQSVLRRISSGFVLGFVLLVAAGTVPAQVQEGNISGEVRLADRSMPDERLQVSLLLHGAVTNMTYCDAEGGFSFHNLLPGPYTVVIEARGFAPLHEAVNVDPGISSTNFVRLVLHPAANERTNRAPDGPPGANRDLVDVRDFAKKFPPGVLKEFDAGRKADERGEAATAMAHYEAVLSLAPGFYPAHNNLGILYMKKGELEVAEREFLQVIEQDHNNAQAYFNLGNVLYITRRNEEAKQAIEEGLRREPGSAKGHYFMGSVLVRMGELPAGEEQLKKARELDPRMPQVLIALATLYLQTGRDGEAIAMFDSFLRQFPNDPMAPKVRAAISKINHIPPP
jgi:tetratricopeptide (TPR) repeat protein